MDEIGGAPAGVQIRTPDYDVWTRREMISLPSGGNDAWLAFLTSQIGKPYDPTAIVAFAVERDWREADSWFCSELQTVALERAGFFPQAIETPSNEITPRDLLMMLSGWRI